MKSNEVARALLTGESMKINIKMDYDQNGPKGNNIKYYMDGKCPACGKEHTRPLKWSHASATSKDIGCIIAALWCPETLIHLRGVYGK